MDVKGIRVPPFYAPMERFLIKTNLHVIGGTMSIALMHHLFIGKVSFFSNPNRDASTKYEKPFCNDLMIC